MKASMKGGRAHLNKKYDLVGIFSVLQAIPATSPPLTPQALTPKAVRTGQKSEVMLRSVMEAQPNPAEEAGHLVRRYTRAMKANAKLAIDLKEGSLAPPSNLTQLESHISETLQMPAVGLKLRRIAEDDVQFKKILLALMDLDCLYSAYLADRSIKKSAEIYLALLRPGSGNAYE